MIIGQDECVFSQFLLSSKMWTGPNSEALLLPKSEGESHMVLAMQSHDSGFGLKVSDEQLSLINANQHQQNYIDTLAAIEVFGSIKKEPLSESPFV